MENEDKKSGLSKIELLNERLSLTLAFSKRYQRSMAVCYLRLHLPVELSKNKDDEMKTVLASKILTRLHHTLRDIDTVISVNRTDFVLLIADITEHDCQVICERIIQSISDTYTIDFHHFLVSSTMGICMYPYGSESPVELQTLAKMQMYEAEEIGENEIAFYSGGLNSSSYRKVLIENDLPYALKKEKLYVLYQPQYGLEQKKIIGAEALIRWNHPSLGEISPVEFISYAEEAGMLTSLFFWVFKEVCKNISSQNLRSIKYSINLSVNQLLLDSLIPRVAKILERYKVNATQITLEITENIEIYTTKTVNEKLHSLREMGFTIALDDFGNGYFSFSDLIKLPLDFIKLDREFVFSLLKNKQHRGVISPIIQMAHNLGLQVIIEGIEDKNQFNEWLMLDCDIIQGYFIRKPISFQDLTDSVNEIEESVWAD
ncbi:MAG: GGDEF domain-containing phosphodiesterase [Bacillus sp. (in: Bacteria)]|nr:GGDEF domain-containing phosphodiesterase [Bacillus sp. (in: firmicutes)]